MIPKLLDLNKILDFICHPGRKETPDYKMFPECRPWPILAAEMISENPVKEIPEFIEISKTAIKHMFSPDWEWRKDLNFWQIFNSSMQFEFSENYVWHRVLKSMKERGDNLTSIISQEDLEAMKKDLEKHP